MCHRQHRAPSARHHVAVPDLHQQAETGAAVLLGESVVSTDDAVQQLQVLQEQIHAGADCPKA